MLLYVMRHGPSEDRAPSGRDADRRLSVAGREVVERAGRRLHEARTAPVPRILASPLRRARETAEIVWRQAGDPGRPVDHVEELSTDADTPVSLVRTVVEAGVDTLLVGHNPNVEALAREIANPAHPFLGFRTATIIAIEVVDPSKLGQWPLVMVFDART